MVNSVVQFHDKHGIMQRT